MNKEYMLGTNGVLISTDDGLKVGIPYVDNLEERLITENEISFLEQQLSADEKKLKDTIAERASHLSSYKTLLLFTTGCALVVPFAVSALCTSGMEDILVSTMFGEMSAYWANIVCTMPASLLFSQVLPAVLLTYRPSKKSVLGYQGRVDYEKEVLEQKRNYLENLQKENVVSIVLLSLWMFLIL